ncbi:MAG: hypothetical protein KJT03_06810 [Verrucomicrobiae bacterium]|nr:hypothetical protein [Verrucomicrobiae bacterium]
MKYRSRVAAGSIALWGALIFSGVAKAKAPSASKSPAEITGIPDGISIRMLTLDNPKGLDAARWDFTDGTTAQDVLAIIRDLKPNVLDRFITGKQDPDMLVPVAAGEPPMTVLEFLDAAQAAGAPDCIITPKINLKWSLEKIYLSATNLSNLPLKKPLRVISLDLYPYFYETYGAEEAEACLRKLTDMGFKLGGNFTGGPRTPSFGMQFHGTFNVNKGAGFMPNTNALEALRETKPEMAKFFLYIDYPHPMQEFTALPVDEQAEIYYNKIWPAQEKYGVTYSYTILQDGWDARKSFTSPNGPYGGKSMYDITKDLINRTRQ